MSKATELALNHGTLLPTLKGRSGWIFTADQLEAFYHAARAEALRGAAIEFNNRYHLCMEPEIMEVVLELRAMADREGK